LWIWFHVKSWILFWGQNDVFGSAIVFLVRMAQLWWVSQFPAETDSLSLTSLTCFCLCSSIISCIIHFISVCFVFWWCYLGNFPSSLDTNWPATTIDAAAVCFLFLYQFDKFCFLSLCQAWFLENFCFWNSLCREASFAELLIVDLLSLGWAVWKWTRAWQQRRGLQPTKSVLYLWAWHKSIYIRGAGRVNILKDNHRWYAMAMVLIQLQSFLLLLCSHVVDNLKNQRFCFDNVTSYIVHVWRAILCLMKILSRQFQRTAPRLHNWASLHLLSAYVTL
jgi:hypothetical protein